MDEMWRQIDNILLNAEERYRRYLVAADVAQERRENPGAVYTLKVNLNFGLDNDSLDFLTAGCPKCESMSFKVAHYEDEDEGVCTYVYECPDCGFGDWERY